MRTLEDSNLFLLVIAVSLIFAWILWRFFNAVLWATVLAIVFAPLYRRTPIIFITAVLDEQIRNHCNSLVHVGLGIARPKSMPQNTGHTALVPNPRSGAFVEGEATLMSAGGTQRTHSGHL